VILEWHPQDGWGKASTIAPAVVASTLARSRPAIFCAVEFHDRGIKVQSNVLGRSTTKSGPSRWRRRRLFCKPIAREVIAGVLQASKIQSLRPVQITATPAALRARARKHVAVPFEKALG